MNSVEPSFLENARQKAIQLSLDLRCEDPTLCSIDDLAMMQGLFVKDGDLKGAVARLVQGDKAGVITVSRDVTLDSRRRFSIAHEMGHFHLHRNEKPAFICTEDMFFEWYSKNQREPEANAFAAELLMPRQLFRLECNNQLPSFELIKSLANRFKTSITSTCIRYIEFGPYPCALFVSTYGVIKWIRRSEDFGYWTVRTGTPVSDLSCAWDYFDKGEKEETPQTVYADAWLKDYNIGGNDYVQEMSIYLDRYDTVLSLIWFSE